MLSVRKTTGLSAKTIDTLRKDFINLSTAIPISARELAEIGAVAGQLGIQNAPDILKFTETIAKVATVTNFTAEEAATSLARIANVFKIPIAEIENLAGVMNELENTTTAKVPQIADFMRRLGPASLQIGLSASEVAGLSATLIDLGFRAELAGTAVSNTFANMIKKADVFGKQMGLTAAEFRLAIQKDGIGTIQKWAEAISKLPADQVIAQFEAVGISGSRARLVFNALSNSTELMGKNLKTASDEVKRGTSLQKEFDIFISGTASKLRLLGNRLGQAAFAIGDVLLPVVNDLIKTAGGDLQKILDGVADKFTKNKDAVRELLDKGYIQFKETSKGILNVMRDLKQPFLDVVSIIGDLAKIFLENVTFFGVGGLLGSIFFGKIGAVGFLAAITATDKTVKFLAESLNGAIDTTDRLNDQIKLLEQQIRTGTKLEDGLFGFSKVVPASTEDLIAMEKQLANLKKTVKEIDEPIKKPFVTVQTETKKVLTTLEEAQLLILKLGQKQVPNFIVSQLTITKILKKEIDDRRKFQLQAFAFEEEKIKKVLKEQILSAATRKIGIKDLTRVVREQERIQITIVKDAANAKLLEIEEGSRAEQLIKENAATAIENIELITTERLKQLKKEVTVESAAQLLLQVNDVNLTAKKRLEIQGKLTDAIDEDSTSMFEAFKIGMASQELTAKTVNQQIAEFGISTYNILKDGFKNIFVSAIKGDFNGVKDAFLDMLGSMVDAFVRTLAVMAAQAAATRLFSLIPGFAKGGFITEDGIFQGNKGELVLNADSAQALTSTIGKAGVDRLIEAGSAVVLGSQGAGVAFQTGAIARNPSAPTNVPQSGFGPSALTLGTTVAFGTLVGPEAGLGSQAGATVGALGGPAGALLGAFIGGAIGSAFVSNKSPLIPVFDAIEANKKALATDLGGVSQIMNAVVGVQSGYNEVGATLLESIKPTASSNFLKDAGQLIATMRGKNIEETIAKMALVGGRNNPGAVGRFSDYGGMNLDTFLRLQKEQEAFRQRQQQEGFQSGVDFVPSNMVAGVHRGERIISAEQNQILTDFIEGLQSAGGRGDVTIRVENLFAKDLNSIIDEVNSDNQNRNIGDFRLMVEEQNTENFNLINA
tara:strand:+ start:2806 stop:6138 length:3333 start_codon:yes stop_codon:yes gene_type:complete